MKISNTFKMWIAIITGGGTILGICDAPIELWKGLGSVAIFFSTLNYMLWITEEH